MVEPYAIAAVMARSFPAPLPKSPIAGVTSPTIIRGMAKDRKLPNNELKVTNIRAILIGKKLPKIIPAKMAITTLASSETFSFFLMLFDFES